MSENTDQFYERAHAFKTAIFLVDKIQNLGDAMAIFVTSCCVMTFKPCVKSIERTKHLYGAFSWNYTYQVGLCSSGSCNLTAVCATYFLSLEEYIVSRNTLVFGNVSIKAAKTLVFSNAIGNLTLSLDFSDPDSKTTFNKTR